MFHGYNYLGSARSVFSHVSSVQVIQIAPTRLNTYHITQYPFEEVVWMTYDGNIHGPRWVNCLEIDCRRPSQTSISCAGLLTWNQSECWRAVSSRFTPERVFVRLEIGIINQCQPPPPNDLWKRPARQSPNFHKPTNYYFCCKINQLKTIWYQLRTMPSFEVYVWPSTWKVVMYFCLRFSVDNYLEK